MPILSDPTLAGSLAVLARYALAGYATAATILTTACLALHVVTTVDRRAHRARRAERPIFLPLETAPAPGPSA